MKKLVVTFVTVLIILVSCKKTDNGPGNSSRTLRYEITANFTGTLIASYTTATGGTANEQVTSSPWIKEVIYASNVTAAVMALSGNGGVAGQKITLTIKRGGSQLGAPIEITANSSGSFPPQSSPVVVF